MEIAKLLADKLGKELVIVDMAFDAVLLSVQQQKADIGMAGLTVKPFKSKTMLISLIHTIQHHRKLFARLTTQHLTSARLKKMLTKFLRVLIHQFLSAVRQAQQVSHTFRATTNSALKSLAQPGRAMQTAHLLFRI